MQNQQKSNDDLQAKLLMLEEKIMKSNAQVNELTKELNKSAFDYLPLNEFK